ncbi:MAG: SSU ribosomal protein S8p (S15Ae), partial [uncultured Solirubrobacteraceae bacterium]
VDDRSHRGLPHPDPQRHPGRPRDGRHALVQAQAGDGPRPARAGLHRGLRRRAAPSGQRRRAPDRPAEVHGRPRLGHLRPQARLAPGPADLRRLEVGPEGPRRHGHRDRLHLPGRDDRPRRAQGGHRRRSPRAGAL